MNRLEHLGHLHMPNQSPVILLSLPGLRRDDVRRMPKLASLCSAGAIHDLIVPFPAVTWPAEATLLTGQLPDQHGVIANGFYWRDKNEVEMWTAGNEVIERPQIWDWLHRSNQGLTSAAWFPMLSKRSAADFVCMPAPVHNPDGSESMWCYTQPTDLYRELLESLGSFPLQHFWGPLANIKSSKWIADSAVIAASKFRPSFFYVYLPHLDYAAQKHGPNSTAALQAIEDLDELIHSLAQQMTNAYGSKLIWIVVSEYAITETSHVTYPNQRLREHGFLTVQRREDGEHLDFENSRAWALVDHQFSHIFVRGSNPTDIERIELLFRGQKGIRHVLRPQAMPEWNMMHPRSGDLILISEPDSWQAYYWWLDDQMAPGFARTVDIHRKPGYDPIELHFDPATRSIPINAELNRGSHAAPSDWSHRQEVVLVSERSFFPRERISTTDVLPAVLRHFQIPMPNGIARSN